MRVQFNENRLEDHEHVYLFQMPTFRSHNKGFQRPHIGIRVRDGREAIPVDHLTDNSAYVANYGMTVSVIDSANDIEIKRNPVGLGGAIYAVMQSYPNASSFYHSDD